MNREDILDDLLDTYERRREQGIATDLSELCHEHPELAPELRRRIKAFQAFDGFAAGDKPREESVAGSNEVFGRFCAIQFHAAGGLGEILLARDEELGRDVALKRIQARWRGSSESRRRFVTEAEITGRLEHPGIVPVYGLGRDAQGQPFYAMRFIRGRSLAEAVEAHHRAVSPSDRGEEQLAPRKLLGSFVAACRTIAFAHSLGVLHRDLKPANIMLGDYGETLVVDWGLAKATLLAKADHDASSQPRDSNVAPPTATIGVIEGSIDTSLDTFDFESSPLARQAIASTGPSVFATQPGQIKGSPAYMSPEQAAGRWDDVGPGSDVYSLGATLYSILSGSPPVQGETIGEVLAKVRAGQITPLRELTPAIPKSLAALCEMAMKRLPAERYASATELADDVERWLADEPVVARRETVRERAARWTRRHKAWTQAGAAALAAIAVVSLVALAVVDRARRAEQVALSQARKSLVAETAAKNAARQAVDEYVRAVQDEEMLRDERYRELRKRLLGHALGYYQRLIEENRDNPAAQRELSSAQRQTAKIAMHTGSRNEALNALDRSQELLERLARDRPADRELQFELAETLSDLSDVQADSNDPGPSEGNMRLRRKIFAQLENQDGDSPLVQASLAACDRSLATHRQIAGELAQARELLQAAIDRYHKLALRSDAPSDTLPHLAEVYRRLAGLEFESGFDERALAAAIEARSKLQALAETARADGAEAHPAVAVEFARVENLIASVEIGAGKLKAALARLEESAARFEVVVRENPMFVDYRHLLAQTYNNIGTIHMNLGETPPAIEALERACEHHTWVVGEHPEFPYYRGELAIVLLNLGVAHSRAGQASEAENAYRRSRTILTSRIVGAFGCDEAGVGTDRSESVSSLLSRAAV